MIRLLGAVAVCASFMWAPARAETYPSRAVRILVPYAPGGATDIVARLIGERMRVTLGQPFIVENKPGAFGIVSIEEVARAQPDGHTLMIGNVSTNAITPIIYKDKFKFDYETSIVPVARLATIPAVVAASASGPIRVKTLAELVEYGRKNPGKLNYSSAGVGSFPHYDAALFAKRANFEAVHVPTRAGAAGMLTDMMTGQVHFGFINAASSLSIIQTGQLTALAVVSEKRLAELPDVPTMAELGYPGIGTLQWQALYAPAGTPPAVLETLEKAAIEALYAPATKAIFEKSLIAPDPTKSPEDAKAWMRAEIDSWKKIVAESGVSVD